MTEGDFQLLQLGGGLSLACLRAGTGRPLLLIHGSLCDARFWQGQLTALAEAGRSVLAPSLPAFYPLHTSQDMRWQDDLRVLETLADSMGDGLDVLGHSRGGFLAYHLALRRPQQVRRLILAEPGGHFAPLTPPTASQAVQAWRDDIIALLERGEVEQAVARFVDGVSRPGSWRASPASFQRMALDNAVTLLSQLRQDALPPYRIQDANALALPVLLIGGERSQPRFRQTMEALARHLPQAHMVEIRGAAHAMNLAHPRRFNQIVAEFLA